LIYGCNIDHFAKRWAYQHSYVLNGLKEPDYKTVQEVDNFPASTIASKLGRRHAKKNSISTKNDDEGVTCQFGLRHKKRSSIQDPTKTRGFHEPKKGQEVEHSLLAFFIFHMKSDFLGVYCILGQN
jgi:hypothetical protein